MRTAPCLTLVTLMSANAFAQTSPAVSDAEFTDVGCWKWDVGCGSLSALLGGSDGSDDDRGDLVAFAHQVGELGVREDAGFDEEFEPVRGLVGFFLDDGELVDEIGSRFPAARGSVVGADGRGRTKKLFADDIGRSRGRQRFGQFDDPQRERLGPGLHRVLIHGVEMVTASIVPVHPTSGPVHPKSDIEHPTSGGGETGPWSETATATIGA